MLFLERERLSTADYKSLSKQTDTATARRDEHFDSETCLSGLTAGRVPAI
jgi:hypothetical protein